MVIQFRFPLVGIYEEAKQYIIVLAVFDSVLEHKLQCIDGARVFVHE